MTESQTQGDAQNENENETLYVNRTSLVESYLAHTLYAGVDVVEMDGAYHLVHEGVEGHISDTTARHIMTDWEETQNSMLKNVECVDTIEIDGVTYDVEYLRA